MELRRFKIINADKKCIGIISAKDRIIASKKLKFRYNDNAYFLELQEVNEIIYLIEKNRLSAGFTRFIYS